MPIEELGRRPDSLWHYLPLLPIARAPCIVSLGEGATPLLSAPRLAALAGINEVCIKNETVNPTGSFKDRQVSVGMTHAREQGHDTVAVVSSGNVAVAAAAYAARAGMTAVLYMHSEAGKGKIAQAAAYGARLVSLDTLKPSEAFERCVQDCAERGWAHLSTAGMYEPFNVEGAKTIAYELYQQYEGRLPEWILAPVGGGGLLGGLWRGFRDLQRMGLITKLPRLAGVQASGCAPLREAINNSWSFHDSLAHPWPHPNTIAGGIADDILFDGHTVLPAIRDTGGVALVVDDDAIRKGVKILAETEGLLCELTSAVVIAALLKSPPIPTDQTVCCILTGHGMKDLVA